MKNQTCLNYEEGWLGERAFFLSPAKCFAILLEDRFFYKEKSAFRYFDKKLKFYTGSRWFA